MSALLSIRAAAREHPNDLAIIADRGITFGDIALRVERMIAWLHETGMAEAPRIALVADLRVETLVALYALMELAIPIVLIHPRLTPAERVVLVAKTPVALTLDEAWTDEAIVVREAAAPARPSPPYDDERCLAVVFTSGSSGDAKAVFLSRRAFVAAGVASAANLGWTAEDRWLLSMPLAHVGGLGIALRCLAARKPVVMAQWTAKLDQVIDAIARHRVTLMSVVPTMLACLIDERPREAFPPHVRAILLGGDRAAPALLETARALKVPALTTYGCTETCAQSATQRPSELPSADAGVGHPLSGTEVSIVEDEILVRGPTLLTGYIVDGRVVSPLTPEGWFPTGDRGRLDASGRLFVTGRKKDIIITGGENVDPREVEDVLAVHAPVAQALVFGVEDERWGEIVAAALVPRSPGALDLGALAEYLAASLAPHKRPRLVAICEALPVTRAAKVDRRGAAAALRDRLVRVVYPKRDAKL